ncbi:MAG: DUF4831 family protein [Bacteroidales bacterium]|nr:DUF4831 family protein [Bacteroidales bacterium]
MNKNRLYYFALAAGIVFWLTSGCTTSERTSVEVNPLDTNQSLSAQDGLIYGLPQTQLSFTIHAIREERIPGPYHQYGEKLLGLTGIPHEKEVAWRMAHIDVREARKLDYQHLYVVKPRGKFGVDWSKFSRNGWIMPFDGSRPSEGTTDFYPEMGLGEQVLFTDLSVKRFVGKETRTVYEKVWRDSLYASVPVEKTQTIEKSTAQKAQEAASFIFMIREKRFELISGMGDYYPEGKAMESALAEMKRLEQKYLSLFKGRTFTDTLTYSVHITPDDEHLQEPVMLFRFSPKQGVLEAGRDQGGPVWLDITLRDNPGQLKNWVSKEADAGDTSRFFYRLPVETTLKLKYGERVIARKYLDLPQYGPVLQIPVEFLNRSRFIYYPEKE